MTSVGKKHLRERLGGVLGEHSNHHPVDNLELCPVKSSNLNEDIRSVQGDLRVITVDDRRQRADSALRVIDHGVHRRVANDVQVLAQLLVLLLFNCQYTRDRQHC
jgi:hypothetical protein